MTAEPKAGKAASGAAGRKSWYDRERAERLERIVMVRLDRDVEYDERAMLETEERR